MSWDAIKHFSMAEFACKCGTCGSDGSEMSTDFVSKLDQIRERCGVPFRILSGYRCPKHNAKVSSTGDNGPHTTGHAADIALSGAIAFRVITQASLGGWMTGIGLQQRGDHARRFIHLDDLRGSTRPTIWTY